MSAGRILFSQQCFSGIGQLYDMFPERLYDVILQKNASLYNELYGMLTNEEKEELNANASFENNSSKIDIKIQDLQNEIKMLKEDPYNSSEARRERFKGMPEFVIKQSIDEFEQQIVHKELMLKFLIETQQLFKRQHEESLLFN